MNATEQTSTASVFVYGTLKRDQCRGHLWPARPISVVAAWTRGVLMGRADYPAMVPGDDRVLGEVWTFDDRDMPEVLRVLDEIEGTNQPGYADLYVRVVVETFDQNGSPLGPANAYHYAGDPAGDGFIRITPESEGDGVSWPVLSR